MSTPIQPEKKKPGPKPKPKEELIELQVKTYGQLIAVTPPVGPLGRKRSSLFEQWLSEGIPSYYVRFHQPVPPGKDKEPVSEFKLQTKSQSDNKYLVNSITYTPNGLVWEAYGEKNIVPLANVIYTRPILA